MAKPNDPKKGSKPSGVRGPGGPPPASSRAPQANRPTSRPGADQGTGFQQALARHSRPALLWMSRLPRWVVVITPALLLFFGLIQTGRWAWLGGILLLVVAALLGWLTALSWPRITFGQRVIRTVIVVALLGVAVLKFMGRF